MVVEQDIAKGHVDMLERLVSFLTTNSALSDVSQQWKILDDRGSSNGYDLEVYMEAPGLSGKEQIFINFAALTDATNDVFSWECRGALGFYPSATFAFQPNNSGDGFSPYWANDIAYTFAANGQGVTIVADFDGVNVVTHFGKLLPPSQPSGYPYPVLIGAVTNSATATYGDAVSSFDVSCFMSPGRGTHLYDNAGTWRPVMNRFGTNSGRSIDAGVVMSPTSVDQFFRTTFSHWESNPISPNPDDSYTLLPFEVFTAGDYPAPNRFGYVDGVYWVTGIGNNAGSIIEVDGQDYLVVKNMARSNWEEYAAVRIG